MAIDYEALGKRISNARKQVGITLLGIRKTVFEK